MALPSTFSMTLVRRDNNTDTSNCTKQTCSLDDAYYQYNISLAANTILLVLFFLSLMAYLLQGFLSRRFIGFTIAMVCGCILEVLGYIGRILLWQNPFKESPFLMQICCLTIAPAFLSAGLYLTLSRIVTTFGASNSRIAPRSYPRIFIPCDILALVLQSLGGAIASTASNQHKSVTVGNNIMIAGLASQTGTLLAFIILCLDFALRTYRIRDFDPAHASLRASRLFRGFLVALSIATLGIFIRSVYRVVELSEGWNGNLIKNQRLFIVLEGVMVIMSVLALNVCHPSVCFREGYDVEVSRALKKEKSGKCWWKRSGSRGEKESGSPVGV